MRSLQKKNDEAYEKIKQRQGVRRREVMLHTLIANEMPLICTVLNTRFDNQIQKESLGHFTKTNTTNKHFTKQTFQQTNKDNLFADER